MELRHFRDDCLEISTAGRVCVRWYYKWSPAFATFLARSGTRKALAKVLIINPALLISRIVNKVVRGPNGV
jgi:hypothetical protein